MEGLIRSTVFDHFCGGVSEEDCLPVVEKNVFQRGLQCFGLFGRSKGRRGSVRRGFGHNTQNTGICERKDSIPLLFLNQQVLVDLPCMKS